MRIRIIIIIVIIIIMIAAAAVVYVIVKFTCDKTNSSPHENKFSLFPEEE